MILKAMKIISMFVLNYTKTTIDKVLDILKRLHLKIDASIQVEIDKWVK